jgi:uncharacterized protein (DUF362 family)
VIVHHRVLEYEALVVVSNLEVHETPTVTLALKNVAMSFPAADHYGHPRSTERHRHRFFDDMHSFIAAMAKAFPIDLAVTVGHPAMIGTEPLGGHTFETGLCITSDDALAADVVGARLLGFDVDAVHHLWEAARLGVGESDVSRMAFPAMSLETNNATTAPLPTPATNARVRKVRRAHSNGTQCRFARRRPPPRRLDRGGRGRAPQ